MPHIRKQHEGANDIYFNQQHQQLIPTTLRPKQHIGRSGDLLKTMVVNRVVNYRQFEGTRITFGEMDIERQGLMPDHWQKQNKMKGEEKKERHAYRAALDVYTKILTVLLWVI